MSAVLGLALERQRLHPGDVLSGTVRVAQGGPSRTLEVFVSFLERTRSYTEAWLTGRTGVLHAGDLVPEQAFAFSLQLPPDAPPPYASRWGELFWEVDAKSDAFGFDAHARQRIIDAPPHLDKTAFFGEGEPAP